MTRDGMIRQAAAELAEEMLDRDVMTMIAFHDICDANEALVEHMCNEGLNPEDLDAANKVVQIAEALVAELLAAELNREVDEL